MSADRISDVRYPEKMERWAGQNSECEISGEDGMLAERIPDVRYPEKVEHWPDRIPDVEYPEKERVEDVESVSINNPTSSINPWVKSEGNYAE